MEYTAICDTVHVALRLEHLTKELQHEIIISEKTYQIVKDLPNISFTKLGPTAIRGREEMLSIFSVKRKMD
jgi:adenylate cyclase